MNQLFRAIAAAGAMFLMAECAASGDLTIDEGKSIANKFFNCVAGVEATASGLIQQDDDYFNFQVKTGYAGTIQPDFISVNKHTSRVTWRGYEEADAVGCRRPTTEPYQMKFSDWTIENLQGKQLELVDTTRIEVLTFLKDGKVAATFGKKDEWLTGPILDWRIESNILVISDHVNRKATEELALVSIDGSTLKIKRKSGEIVQYKINIYK